MGQFKDILDAAIAGKKYEARVDHFAAPTSMATYVEFMIKALEQKATGTFHIVSKGRASRYDFAAKILELAGYDPGTVLVPKTDPKTAENVVLESLMLEMVGVRRCPRGKRTWKLTCGKSTCWPCSSRPAAAQAARRGCSVQGAFQPKREARAAWRGLLSFAVQRARQARSQVTAGQPRENGCLSDTPRARQVRHTFDDGSACRKVHP